MSERTLDISIRDLRNRNMTPRVYRIMETVSKNMPISG